jgi:hypothetical protein
MNGQNKTITLLVNPFFYIAGGQALALGLAAILLAALVGSCGNTHFDGVLDTHVGASAPLWFFLAEGVIDWLCLSVVLWVCGKIISQTAFRAVDLFGTQALARWPALFISLVALPKVFLRFSTELLQQINQGNLHLDPLDAFLFLAIVTAMIPLVCWMVALMYRSFSVSCNVKGGKAIGTFILGLLIAEALSKLALALVMHFGAVQTPIPAKPAAAPAGDVRSAPLDSSTQADDEITGAATHFVELLVNADFASAVAQFDATMKSELPEPKLREVWQSLQSQSGPFQKTLGTRRDDTQGYKIVLVTCQFERAVLDTRVVFDSNRQVAGLFFVPTATGPRK